MDVKNLDITPQEAFVKRKIKIKPKDIVSRWGVNIGRVGRALLFPIAVLPMAAVMLRIGAQIPSDTEFSAFIAKVILAPARAVFSYLPIIYAIGVAFGFAKDARGEAALCGFLGMFIIMLLLGSKELLGGNGLDLTNAIYGAVNFGQPAAVIGDTTYTAGFHTIFSSSDATGKLLKDNYDSLLATNVLNGIVSGALVAFIYNKFNGISMPNILGFFSGRRLIPALTLMVLTVYGVFWCIIFPWFGWALFEFSNVLGSATGNQYANAGIMTVYALLNGSLIPFGLHHIPNTLFWFVFGSHPDAAGHLVYGDINIFSLGIAQGNTSGTFQSGFFVNAMFGVPALAAAIWYCAEKEDKKAVAGMMISGALILMLTGIGEQLVFLFLFAVPWLYVANVLLSAVFCGITGLFGIQIGFGFSAGLVDYVLSVPKSLDIIAANRTGVNAVFANPGWIFVIGAVSIPCYYYTGKFLIKRFNMNTPGRGTNRIDSTQSQSPVFANMGAGGSVAGTKVQREERKSLAGERWYMLARRLEKGLGGIENIELIEWCATRLRLTMKDMTKVDDIEIKRAGAVGSLRTGSNGYQVIIGPSVEMVANELLASQKEVAEQK